MTSRVMQKSKSRKRKRPIRFSNINCLAIGAQRITMQKIIQEAV